MRIGRIALTIVGVALAVSGCGAPSNCDTDAKPTPTIASPSGPVVVGADGRPYIDDANGYSQKLKCAEDYTPIEVALGTHVESDANYRMDKIEETTSYGKIQTGVKVHVQMPQNVLVPGIVIHTAGSNDREYHISIGSGGAADFELKTVNYAYLPSYYWNYPINSIVLCTWRTA